MPDALTCQTCRRAPATHVLIVDFPALFGRSKRRFSLTCAECLNRILPAARSMAGPASVWPYALTTPALVEATYAR